MPIVVVVNGDILARPCDLLILKHANGFYGVDELVASRIGFERHLAEDEYSFVEGKHIQARKVLFLGVGPLGEFRYAQIREFADRALELASEGKGKSTVICSPIHGPGYGLDDTEAFLSLVGGFLDAIERGAYPSDLQRIEIVEANNKRAERLARVLERFETPGKRAVKNRGGNDPLVDVQLSPKQHRELASYGAKSETKIRLFIAMPFRDEFADELTSIREAASVSDVICERADEKAYLGDVLGHIKNRISTYDGVIALLNKSNPNVFLEVGFAWAVQKPTILIARKGQKLPFDVSAQRCIIYTGIYELRDKLAEELRQLKSTGLLMPRRSP